MNYWVLLLTIGQIDCDLHDLGSPFGGFAQSIEVGDGRFGPNAFLQVVFGNFSQRCFGGLEVTLWIEQLLAEGH